MSITREAQNTISEFLSMVVHIDTETTTTGDDAEIVELGTTVVGPAGPKTTALLIRPVKPIPADSSAVNNISNYMVESKRTFVENEDAICNMLNVDYPYFAAHNADFDIRVINANAEKAGFKIGIDRTNTICTMRLAKHLLIALDDPTIRHSQQYLRYYLDLDISPAVAPHRAGNDTEINAVLLKKLVTLLVASGKVTTDGDLGKKIHTLCWSPIPIIRWPHRGKHQGDLLTEIPTDYFEWALKTLDRLKEGTPDYDEDLAAAVAKVMGDRLGMTSK